MLKAMARWLSTELEPVRTATAVYARVFISLHCYSHSLLSRYWNFINYVSEKYHHVALLRILFMNEIETILPYLKTFSSLFL